MIKKTIVCDVCDSEMSWDNAYPKGLPVHYSMELPAISKEHICIQCAERLTQILRESIMRNDL